MYVMENAAPCLSEAKSAWSGFKDFQIGEIVETTCSSTGTGRETPETLPRQSRELRPDFNKGPWTLIRFFINKILPEDFDLDQVLRDSGITINMVPCIVEHKDQGSYELVVATPYLDMLSEKFHDFRLVVDYDPFEPSQDDIRNYEICEAKKRARINTLSNAAER